MVTNGFDYDVIIHGESYSASQRSGFFPTKLRAPIGSKQQSFILQAAKYDLHFRWQGSAQKKDRVAPRLSSALGAHMRDKHLVFEAPAEPNPHANINDLQWDILVCSAANRTGHKAPILKPSNKPAIIQFETIAASSFRYLNVIQADGARPLLIIFPVNAVVRDSNQGGHACWAASFANLALALPQTIIDQEIHIHTLQIPGLLSLAAVTILRALSGLLTNPDAIPTYPLLNNGTQLKITALSFSGAAEVLQKFLKDIAHGGEGAITAEQLPSGVTWFSGSPEALCHQQAARSVNTNVGEGSGDGALRSVCSGLVDLLVSSSDMWEKTVGDSFFTPSFISPELVTASDVEFWTTVSLVYRLSLVWEIDLSLMSPFIILFLLDVPLDQCIDSDTVQSLAPIFHQWLQTYLQFSFEFSLELRATEDPKLFLYEVFNGNSNIRHLNLSREGKIALVPKLSLSALFGLVEYGNFSPTHPIVLALKTGFNLSNQPSAEIAFPLSPIFLAVMEESPAISPIVLLKDSHMGRVIENWKQVAMKICWNTEVVAHEAVAERFMSGLARFLQVNLQRSLGMVLALTANRFLIPQLAIQFNFVPLNRHDQVVIHTCYASICLSWFSALSLWCYFASSVIDPVNPKLYQYTIIKYLPTLSVFGGIQRANKIQNQTQIEIQAGFRNHRQDAEITIWQ
ncbi:hypothetical protein C8J56DRAFT_888233 [Mycena floridula]|nr:hypothetical protein C8J56DRAFT_888233 [Mycena floridula]